MNLTVNINAAIDRLTRQLLAAQHSDGSWRYCFEIGSTMTDSFMIIILRILQLPEEQLVQQLSQRIVAKQHQAGYWSAYPDEQHGNLSATVEAYYALLYAGYVKKDDKIMLKARAYILEKGGLNAVTSVMTKALLAATGQLPWSRSLIVPIEFLLLPDWSPISFSDIVGYARVHIAPILILSSHPDTKRPEGAPNLADLLIQRDQNSGENNGENSNKSNQSSDPSSIQSNYLQHDSSYFDDSQAPYNPASYASEQHRFLLQHLKNELLQLLPSPQSVKQEALHKAENFMLDRIEPNGTLYSYASSTFLMILALLSLGYDRRHLRIRTAVQGLKSFTCLTGEQMQHVHIQNSPPTIWDTALISHALQQAGLPAQHPAIQRAGTYLLSRQQHRLGDWYMNNPNPTAGGWGFSDINTMIPDVDDTTAALRAIHHLAPGNSTYTAASDKGLQWLLSMQNDDGGWSAFEKNKNKAILTWLPYDGADAALTDPSTTDLTGRTLEYLGNTLHLTQKQAFVRRAVAWLIQHQEQNGSWHGKWGICYLYGTWAAVTGMTAVGVSPSDPAIVRAARWLSRVQNADGGWGESCESDRKKTFVPLAMSTPSQTAWALDALIAISPHPTAEIQHGVKALLQLSHPSYQAMSYPTGAGLPGHFYITYHSYNYIWPLLALSHYRRKYLR
ncbi:squalene--hopene cyclase [Paenibacillus sp. 481]|nr:squalene--hopene cyclase [Paenibacillus sp. 481]